MPLGRQLCPTLPPVGCGRRRVHRTLPPRAQRIGRPARPSDILVIMAKTAGFLLLLSLALTAAPPASRDSQTDSRLKKSFRHPDQKGWIYTHLEGTPSEIGFQHGYLLAPEIEDTQKVVVLGLTHDSKKDYAFFRTAAEKVLWPHIENQYREELKGIAEGLKAKGVALDVWDVVVLNA